MHKMLKVYLENYLDDINRDKRLQKIKEYKEAYDELNKITYEIIHLLEKEVGSSKAYDYDSKLDELNWIITTHEIEDAFELGFYTGLQIGIDTYKNINTKDEETI